ncbi:MAG: hypothetical protein M1375_03980 [Candidatus Thermoplasmatota archaeon]|jgi:hypothetical protein|nr:hypothetical protein [Candidatus Thermoplasmatota archaeon]MCL5791113.1 hypothetical protein [Candidatus Thermoplasmatota archaeon]
MVARSRYAYGFIPINIGISFGMFYIIGLFYKISSMGFLYYGVIPFSLFFAPLMLYVMLRRRKNSFSVGEWSVYKALMNHKAIYISSIIFYIFSIFFLESYSFTIPSAVSNDIFYIFTGALTAYYLIVGFGIAGVGMEIKKKRKSLENMSDQK